MHTINTKLIIIVYLYQGVIYSSCSRNILPYPIPTSQQRLRKVHVLSHPIHLKRKEIQSTCSTSHILNKSKSGSERGLWVIGLKHRAGMKTNSVRMVFIPEVQRAEQLMLPNEIKESFAKWLHLCWVTLEFSGQNTKIGEHSRQRESKCRL